MCSSGSISRKSCLPTMKKFKKTMNTTYCKSGEYSYGFSKLFIFIFIIFSWGYLPLLLTLTLRLSPFLTDPYVALTLLTLALPTRRSRRKTSIYLSIYYRCFPFKPILVFQIKLILNFRLGGCCFFARGRPTFQKFKSNCNLQTETKQRLGKCTVRGRLRRKKANRP